MKASEFRSLIKEQVKKVLSEALNAVDSKLLTNHETLTPAVYRNLMLNAKKGILKHMTQPDGKIHFWNPATKEYVAKLITYNGKGEYLYSNAIDKAGNLVEGINEATSIQKDLASRIHNAIEGDEANKKKIADAIRKNQSQFNTLTVNIVTGYEGSSGMDNRLDRLRTLSPTKLKLVLSELNAILGINEDFDASKMKVKDTIELKNSRTGNVGTYTIKRILGGSSNIKEIEVLNRSNQPMTLYYSKERGLQNFKGDVYEYITESKIGKLGINESAMSEIDQMAKDASTFNQFAMEFFKEYPNIKQDEKMGFVKWLKTVYMDARNNK